MVPQGGNTGLVGGGVPVYDEVVVSTARLNRIGRICVDTNTVNVEAGVVLQTLEEALIPHGMTIPIDLGAKGSCMIGGNVATNAGGVHLLRYGSLHGCVLGLTVVLPNGTILDLDSQMRKDNTGFDLKQLFIGSEGSLGIITDVTLALPPLPRSRLVAFLGCESYDHVRRLLVMAKEELGETLSAFEMLDDKIVELCEEHCHGVKLPLSEGRQRFYALVEAAGSNVEHDQAKLDAFATRAMEEGVVKDGVVAQDETQLAAMWRIRETAPEGVLKAGGKAYKYDISLPLANFYQVVEELRERVGTRGVVVGYGHMGDCNLHLNVASPDPDILQVIEPFVWDFVKTHRGSISAEHGVGLQKVKKMHYSKSPEAIELMKTIKRALDPNLIMNPYKIVDLDY